MGNEINVGHRQQDGTVWDEWETGEVPWCWMAVCRDPVVEARGRSLAELRRGELSAVSGHRGGAGCMWERGCERVGGHVKDVGFDADGVAYPVFDNGPSGGCDDYAYMSGDPDWDA